MRIKHNSSRRARDPDFTENNRIHIRRLDQFGVHSALFQHSDNQIRITADINPIGGDIRNGK
jgi:hypothetical protein